MKIVFTGANLTINITPSGTQPPIDPPPVDPPPVVIPPSPVPPLPDIKLTFVTAVPTPVINGKRLNYGKHTAMLQGAAGGPLFMFGGDGQGQYFGGNDSGTMDTVASYNPPTKTYKTEFLYEGYVNEPTPRGLDFCAPVYVPGTGFVICNGYSGDYGVEKYPWKDFKFTRSKMAAFKPETGHFVDLGSRPQGTFGEGFAGSWDSKRSKIVWTTDQKFYTMDLQTKAVTFRNMPIPSSHRIETANTWYDADSDDLYFVQLNTGRVYAYNITGNALRPICVDLVPAFVGDGGMTRSVIFIPKYKHVLIVYTASDTLDAPPWKLVNLTTGKVQHLDLFAPGCDYHNTGAFHTASDTVVVSGGNGVNGSAFYHYSAALVK